jgi:hypothetical protein
LSVGVEAVVVLVDPTLAVLVVVVGVPEEETVVMRFISPPQELVPVGAQRKQVQAEMLAREMVILAVAAVVELCRGLQLEVTLAVKPAAAEEPVLVAP